MNKKYHTLLLASLVGMSTAASAQSMARYSFGSSTSSATTLATGVTASDLDWNSLGDDDLGIAGADVNYSTVDGPDGDDSVFLLNPGVTQSGRTNAVNAGDMITFSVTTSSAFDFTGLNLDIAIDAIHVNSFTRLALLYDVGSGFVSGSGNGVLNPTRSGTIIFSEYGWDFTDDTALQGFTGTVDFQLIFYGQAVSSFNEQFRVDDINVTGVVPEPSSYAAILGLFSLCVLAARRRK